jgi:hypothetical protein
MVHLSWLETPATGVYSRTVGDAVDDRGVPPAGTPRVPGRARVLHGVGGLG